MKRALVLGFGIALGSAAVAQPPTPAPNPTPVSVYPGTSIRTTQLLTPQAAPTITTAPAARVDPLQPLGGLLAMPLPTAPTVPAGACASRTCAPACGSPLYPTACRDGGGKSRPCLDRVVSWLTWHPGPSLLPVCTPTPYQTPLQAYFACMPVKNPGYPAAATCASPAPHPVPAAVGGKLASAFGLGGATTSAPRDVMKAQPSASTPATPRQATPQVSRGVPGNEVVIPLPAIAEEVTGNFSGRCALDRLLAQFSRHGVTDSAVVPASYQPTR